MSVPTGPPQYILQARKFGPKVSVIERFHFITYTIAILSQHIKRFHQISQTLLSLILVYLTYLKTAWHVPTTTMYE